ncbi:cytochrome c oxidase subunit 3 [Novosphingobium lentum]|uniref:cytochrome c oxidase subunit 3 n=1 Tax=Novosphingobium lentum TaxID=145287 RepID=UPI0008344187|nr:cytochrome c oxidase subunit 3 [Novosphingobium lentum]
MDLTPASAPVIPASDTDPRHPGTSGIWTFVFIDMIVFAMFFLVYLSERARLPALFARSQAQLLPLAGLAGTLMLLTSSWCMAEAVHAVRARQMDRARMRLNLAALFGLAFVANKLWEYCGKLSHGLTPVTNGFFTFYFLITGLHFLHVLGGLAFIGHCATRLADEGGTALYQKKIENVGLFWHFVDMLWLFIFPMLYLAGAR